jgi:hypothetical protein
VHEFFLRYRNFRHLKLALGLLALASVAYYGHAPLGGRSGRTWVGYGLGGLCTLLIAWLMWFGVRKRRYRNLSGAPLRGWLSAHVYLGSTLVFLVPLHSGFQLGWNVHSLAYALLSVVIASGIVGAIMYSTVPQEMTQNGPGEKLASLLQRLAELDAECTALARGLPDVFAQAAALSVNETRIGGGILRQLSGIDRTCGTSRAFEVVTRHAATAPDDLGGTVTRLLGVLARKREVLRRIRRDIRLKALLDVWLLFHVPLSFGMLVAVAIHVFVVLYHR